MRPAKNVNKVGNIQVYKLGCVILSHQGCNLTNDGWKVAGSSRLTGHYTSTILVSVREVRPVDPV